ncbi:MAG: DMT family transporter [Rhizobiales bacterium]|nr:DMT family transporter [Hyphomicrobiales bacterium]
MRIESKASIAVAISGFLWGLFWIPLRALEHAGLHGIWGLALFYGLPALMVLPLFALRRRQFRASSLRLSLIGVIFAVPLLLYSIAVLETAVIRAILLFYLTPVWSTLLERLVLGERVTAMRIAGIGLAFTGILIMFGANLVAGESLGPGDWMALAAGFGWSVSTLALRLNQDLAAPDLFAQNFIWSGLVLVPLLWFFAEPPAPPLNLALAQLWWSVPVTIGIVMTAVFTSVWGAPKISPGLTGLLYMTEISAGAITAAIWANEPFGLRELAGIVSITLAGAIEPVWTAHRRRTSQA